MDARIKVNDSIDQIISEAKKIQDIIWPEIKIILSLLRQNKIDYVVCFGSLLGAIRHKGFVPWDDDFDILVSEDDRQRVKKTMENRYTCSVNDNIFDNYNLYYNQIHVADIFFPQRINFDQDSDNPNKMDNTGSYIFSDISVDFLDESVNVPSNYNDVLNEYYGNDWKDIAYVTNHKIIQNSVLNHPRHPHGGNSFNYRFKSKYTKIKVSDL